MNRRELLALAGGFAAAMPRLARAQQPTIPVVGFLSSRSAGTSEHLAAAFRRGLGESGYVDGQTVAIAYRWADGPYARLPGLAEELIALKPAVIAATGGSPAALAAKAATASIPVVFTTGGDPVAAGLVESFNRPNRNVTGLYVLTTPLEPKRLEVLAEAMPNAGRIGVLVNPRFADVEVQLRSVQEAARQLGREIEFLPADNEAAIERVFATLADRRIGALLVTSDPFFNSHPEHLVGLATRYAVPAIYSQREFAAAGGLLTYGTNLIDAYRQVGVYVARILKGAKPADLPVQQSIKVELLVNLKTARTLGLTIPLALLGRADEVIE